MSTFLNEPLEDRRVGVLESKILRTLLYFDIFHHPLRAAEIRRYLHGRAGDDEDFDQSLQRLVEEGYAQKSDGFYAVRKVELLSRRRLDGEDRAQHSLIK